MRISDWSSDVCSSDLTAEQQLIIFGALAVDAEDADLAGMMVAAGVDAARDLDLELTDVELTLHIRETLRNLLRQRDRARVGEGAIIAPGARDDIGDEIEIDVREARGVERLPDGIERSEEHTSEL